MEVASQLATRFIFDHLISGWVIQRRTDLRAFGSSLQEAIEGPTGRSIGTPRLTRPSRAWVRPSRPWGFSGRTSPSPRWGYSRGYLVRNGQVEQVTQDQSLAQHLVEQGQMTEADAEASPGRNIILQALGPKPTVDVVFSHRTALRGDVVVLCSDGLSGVVTEEEIQETVNRCQDPAVACEDLVDLANSRGGPDNITVIVARLD